MKIQHLLFVAVVLLGLVALGLRWLGPSEEADTRTEGLSRGVEVARQKTQEGAALRREREAKEEVGRRDEAPEARGEVPEESGTPEAPASVAHGPWIIGFVVGDDGLPVSGAEVEVQLTGFADGVLAAAVEALSEEAETDGQGRFRVPRGLIFRGDATISIRARGYLLAAETRALEDVPGDLRLGSFVIQRGVVLGGQVLSAEGVPVADAFVRRTTPEDTGLLDGMLRMAAGLGEDLEGVAHTDDEGRFLLEHERAGEYVLVVEHDSHPSSRFRGVTPLAGGEDLTLRLTLEPSAAIAGRVLDFPEGRRGVSIHCVSQTDSEGQAVAPAATFFDATFGGGQSALIEPDGTFRVEGLPVGASFRVEASIKNGFFGRSACSEAAVVRAGTEDVELQWDPGARVTFRVEEAETGRPITAGLLRYRWQDQVEGAMPDPQKRLEFEEAEVVLSELRTPGETGRLELAVIVEGYLEHRVEGIQVTSDGDVDLGTIRLKRAPLLRVRVVEAATGKPLRGARVSLRSGPLDEEAFFSLSGGAASGRTDRDGLCELPALTGETARLSVRKRGYAPLASTEVPMPREAAREELVRLVRGGALHIRVLDTADLPVPSARVRLRGPDDEEQDHGADSRGELRLRDLIPGEYALRAERPDSSGAVRIQIDADDEEELDWSSHVVTSGAEAEVVLEVPAQATLSGFVSARGEPVQGARVTLFGGEEGSEAEELLADLSSSFEGMGDGAPVGGRTDGAGRYRLSDVPTGKHRLRVKRGEGSPAKIVPVEIRLGENHLDVELPSSSVSGRVVDARGDGVEGARVEAVRAAVFDEGGEELEQARQVMTFFGASAQGGVRSIYDGSFEIPGVPHGEPLVVEVRAPGYVVARSEVLELREDEDERGVRVVLEPAGSLRVTTSERGGFFQAVHAWRVGGEDGPPRSAMALVQDGQAVLTDLAPGTWSVSRDEEERGDGQRVEVRGGETSELALVP